MTTPRPLRTVAEVCAAGAYDRAKKAFARGPLVPTPKAVQACADAARRASEVTERQYVEVLREQLECSN
jgi:hypothetical protein